MTAEVPAVSGWLQNGFQRFLRRFLRRHFHAIGVERHSLCDAALSERGPLLVYGNHPSWWDPLIAHFLNRTLIPQRQFYAPIDAIALEQYKVLGKLGFYGVQPDTSSGAAEFLRRSLAILHARDTAVWITPEGRFADVRDHTATLAPGLSHLCTRLDGGGVLPLAIEYTFWEERLPVCLISFGTLIDVTTHRELSKKAWNELLEKELRATQDRLMRLAVARDSEPFDNLLRGKAGAGAFYDLARRLNPMRWGATARSQHGDQFE